MSVTVIHVKVHWIVLGCGTKSIVWPVIINDLGIIYKMYVCMCVGLFSQPQKIRLYSEIIVHFISNIVIAL